LHGSAVELTKGSLMKEIVNSSKTKSSIKLEQNHTFDAQAFLDSVGVARRSVEYRRSQEIYSQSDPATSVMYIQDGGVKLSVVNEVGRMAVVGMLGPGDFFGEGCLAGQHAGIGTATAIISTAILVIGKKDMHASRPSKTADFAHGRSVGLTCTMMLAAL
jgi:CRP-like cAMP-binding protein